MTGALHAAELVVRASLQKEAIGAFDKAVLKHVVAPTAVLGAGALAANEVMGNPVKRQMIKHQMRMQKIRATYDPRTGRMI